MATFLLVFLVVVVVIANVFAFSAHRIVKRPHGAAFRIAMKSSPDNDDTDAYAKALQTHPANDAWWSSLVSLPFECTSCGKCCKTKGSVWMSPTETNNAAQFLNLSTEDFVAAYASHTLSDGNQSWIQVKNDPTGEACVFLEENQCRIYQARPIQCSTYPFWPNILESEAAWDEEVRLADDKQGGPYWTPDDGGCEGMQYIMAVPAGANTDDARVGVSIEEAQEKLLAYEWEERRFPKTLANLKSITKE
jgi:uncharacterized protein